jgi:2-polyprenyl-3-methyl-5-hydroxy-6-metoxy-1,4-benzoquinol methylase
MNNMVKCLSEFESLQSISEQFGYSNGVMASSITYSYRVMIRHLVPGTLLELGPAEGLMTRLLVESFADITVVEASTKFCEILKVRHPEVDVINCLFEDFEPKRKFDNIILGHVLEHVLNPIALLKKVKSWLLPGGIIFAAVPNSHSLHRQAAVTMGLLNEECELNNSDIAHGHRRVFSPDSFREVFISAGLDINYFGGYWLKPLSNKQIEDSWSREIIGAFMLLGEKYPDIAGEIYIVAS